MDTISSVEVVREENEAAFNGAPEIERPKGRGYLVLMRRQYERIRIGEDFYVEVMDLYSAPAPWLQEGRSARLLFGITLQEGQHIRLQGDFEDPNGISKHEIALQLVRAQPRERRVRISLCGSENSGWRSKLPKNDPTLQPMPSDSGVSVERQRLERLYIGQDFFITVADVESGGARLEINAKMFEGEHFILRRHPRLGREG